jgi:hypothetical protein
MAEHALNRPYELGFEDIVRRGELGDLTGVTLARTSGS